MPTTCIARDSLDAALRFIDAAQATFELLARTPELGELCRFRSPRAAGVRVWRIKGFERYLVFYRPTEAGIRVVRVLHAARDWEVLFSGECHG